MNNGTEQPKDQNAGDTFGLPPDIYQAFLRQAKRLTLRSDGQRKTLGPWSGHFSGIVSILSYSQPGNRASNLSRLVSLSRQGLLIENPVSRKGAVRSFTLTPDQIEELGARAIREWEAVGYVIGQAVDEIQPTQKEARNA